MSERRHERSRTRSRIMLQTERLEGRELLSGTRSLAHPAVTTVHRSIAIEVPGTFISQHSGDLDVTLNLDAPNATRTSRGVTESVKVPPKSTGRENTEPLTVEFSATLGSITEGNQTVALPASASDTFTPLNELITFPPGVTSEEVSIPINAGAVNPGEVPIALSVTSSSSWGPIASGPVTVYLIDSPQALPPTITSARLITAGRHASGIAITFSKPMAPATVENVQNYDIGTTYYTQGDMNPLVPYADWFFGSSMQYGPIPHRGKIALKSAQYDAATDTVTLIPTRPLNSSTAYTLGSPINMTGHVITDSEGDPLNVDGDAGGSFWITLQRKPYTAPAPTISDAS